MFRKLLTGVLSWWCFEKRASPGLYKKWQCLPLSPEFCSCIMSKRQQNKELEFPLCFVFSEELERSEIKASLKLWVHCDSLDGPEALQVLIESRRTTEFDFVNLEPKHTEHVLLIDFYSCTSVKAVQLLISSGRLFCGLSKWAFTGFADILICVLHLRYVEQEHVCCWPTPGENDCIQLTPCVRACEKLSTSLTPAPQGVWSRLKPQSPPTLLPSTLNADTHTHRDSHSCFCCCFNPIAMREAVPHQPYLSAPSALALAQHECKQAGEPAGSRYFQRARVSGLRLCSVVSFCVQNKRRHSARWAAGSHALDAFHCRWLFKSAWHASFLCLFIISYIVWTIKMSP